jgi:diguanylate cyclase (GGDEF)-like protein
LSLVRQHRYKDRVVLLAVVAGLCLLAGLVLGRLRAGRPASGRELHSRIAAESFPNGALLLFDRRLRHTFAAGRGLRAMGIGAGEVEGRTVREAFEEETWTVLEPAYRAALEGQESVFELPHGHRDHLHRVVPVRNRAGAIVAGMLVAQDITDSKVREHRLKQWASRDGLTGVWNRERLLAELDRFLAEGRRRDDRAGSLLYLDLDGFKAVNDSHGHAAGDELLRAVAQAIEGSVRFSDTVARIGGDEFAVLLPRTTIAQAERVAEKIEAAVVSVWPAGMRGGASVGAIALERGRGTAAAALAAADREMYEVKRSRRIRRAS